MQRNHNDQLFFRDHEQATARAPSEMKVKRGVQIIHGDKLLEEKLGRNDPCPCGSGKKYKKCHGA